MSKSFLRPEEQVRSLWELGGLTWGQLAKRVWHCINDNDLINRGYELAYNFLLAVFPLLLVVLTLLGIFASHGSSLRDSLFSYLQTALPPSAYQLIRQTLQEVMKGSGGGKLTFGLLFSLYSGSSGVTQLMSTLNAAYEVREQRSWIRVHLTSIALTLAMAILTILAIALVLAGGYTIHLVGQAVGLSTFAYTAFKFIQWAAALAFIIFAFAIIYYYAPDVESQHWYWITPGSVVGVAIWILASGALRAYLHFLNTYSKTYGSVGAVIILMLWFYVTGLAFLIGGQINAIIEHAAAEHGHVEAKAPGQKAA